MVFPAFYRHAVRCVVLCIIVVLGGAVRAYAQAIPVPLATPSNSPAPAASIHPIPSPVPTASASPRALGLHLATDLTATSISRSATGPGITAPEAPGFVGGSPLAPNTPYDLFSSAPEISGNAVIGDVRSTLTASSRAFDLSLTAGLASLHGSATNAVYWGENVLPTLNPHLGSQALAYAVAFPRHAGGDDATATRISILSGAFATADGNLRLRGGWFDLTQTDRFVFAQPALTSLNPAIAYAPAETLSSGLASLDSWQPQAIALPLHGIDAFAKRGATSLEMTRADLPSLPGESARLAMASLVFDRGDGARFSGQVAHVATSGTPFVTTVPFGADPAFTFTPQGVLPTSTLSGQRQTIAGARAAFSVLPSLGVAAVVEVGRAWYDAAPAARPGTSAPGGFYHGGIARTRGRVTAAVDFYRMEPRYATLILPYGALENQWSVAFAWPGQWLKSNYQLIDNSVLGVNRQGYRLRYLVDRGPLELHLEYTDVHQIEAETIASAQQTGFVDGYYLPQVVDAATFGRQKRSALWIGWHPAIGDLTLDIVDDTEYRPFHAGHLEDRVAYEAPQAVASFARHVSPAVVASTGLGRYAMKGTFAEPIDFAERIFFIGAQIRQTPRASVLATFRRTTFDGISTYPKMPLAPAFAGSAFIIEQRLRI